MDEIWISNGNDESKRKLDLYRAPAIHVFIGFVMCHWPFYYFYGKLSRWYAEKLETYPCVSIPITREQRNEIAKVLWGETDVESESGTSEVQGSAGSTTEGNG